MAIIAVLIDGEVAHLRPTLRLSESLTRAGHQVFYLGLASLRQTVERIGYRYRSLFEDLCPETETTASDVVTTSRLFERLLSGGEIAPARARFGSRAARQKRDFTGRSWQDCRHSPGAGRPLLLAGITGPRSDANQPLRHH